MMSEHTSREGNARAAELCGLRKQAGITQAAFAERIGITANALARLERGERMVSEPVMRLARIVAKGGGS